MSRLKFRVGAVLAAATLGGLTFAAAASAAEPKFSPTDKLVAEEDIRNNLALYALLADGDGIKGKDSRALADKLMAPDVVTELFFPGSKEPVRMVGREAVAGPQVVPHTGETTISRHYLVETYFESVTPTTAKTITTSVHFRLTPNLVGKDCKTGLSGNCGGVPERIIMWIYHMDWVKNASGWQVSYNGLHMDN